MKRAKKRLSFILNRAKSLGLTTKDLQQLEIVQKLCSNNNNNNCSKQNNNWRFNSVFVLSVILGLFGWYHWFQLSNDSQCLIDMPSSLAHLFREPDNCQSLCADVSAVDHVQNVDKDDFENNYAYSGRPVVVTDGTRDWSSLDTFTFDFFRKIYKNENAEQNQCQFFPYKTEFSNLYEALNMSEDRVQMRPGTRHWYFGWSSCNSNATEVLRRHYRKPYFLPKMSESTTVDWIFMGGAGKGAHLHVDNVQYPSWQAQLSGKKRWRLVPPPECYFSCKEIETVVNPGEVIVVDTNRWYHQTFIISNEISITIGSEFD